MPLEVKELVKLIENLGYKVSHPSEPADKGLSIVDELLGAFEGAVPKGMTSTEYLKELRESGST